MAVIIQDMNMPAQCLQCPFGFRTDNMHTGCSRNPLENPVEDGDERPKHCPLKDENTSNKPKTGQVKEARMMKALIAYSGPQVNGLDLTPEAIRHMHYAENAGKPLFPNVLTTNNMWACGYLNKTEIQYNQELSRTELWGYFTYVPEEVDIAKTPQCTYSISYNSKDMDEHKRICKCDLINCFMCPQSGSDREPHI